MNQAPQVEKTSRGAIFIALLIAFFGGYFFGVFRSGGHSRAVDVSAARKVPRSYFPLDNSPVTGAGDALLTVVEFADFECGHCARAVRLQKRMMAQFPGQLQWVFKQYPLNTAPGSKNMLSAQASLAAHAQGKFWEYQELLFGHPGRHSPQDLAAFAQQLGLDQARFQQALKDPELPDLIKQEHDQGKNAGVNGTPTFYINGRQIVGGISYGELESVLQQELAYARSLILKGTPPAQLYETIAKGGPTKSSAP